MYNQVVRSSWASRPEKASSRHEIMIVRDERLFVIAQSGQEVGHRNPRNECSRVALRTQSHILMTD